jgi:1-phosphofructokinase
VIATVTLNPAVDRTMVVPGFALGRTNRIQAEWIDPGGKGINVARVARRLGCPVVASGFLAGTHGRAISQALSADDILTDFVELPGETRVNLKLVDPEAGTETEVNEPGVPVAGGHLEDLVRRIDALAARCAVVVFSGSLPPGVPADTYADLIALARRRGARTILDAAAEALASGLTAGPDLVKPNRAEAEELLEGPLKSEDDLMGAARALLRRGARAVALSVGAEGSLLLAGDGGAWRARPPLARRGSTVGAGDAMVAAFAYALVNAYSWPDALRLATAASAASAGGDPAEWIELAARVAIEDVSGRGGEERPLG